MNDFWQKHQDWLIKFALISITVLALAYIIFD